MGPVSVWQWSLWGLLLCLLCSLCLGSPTPSTAPEKRAGSQGLRFRLAGFPRKPFEGRVEIQRAGEWGTICDDDFTLQAAHVLCRELGFTEATGWTHSAKYGPGTGEQCFRHSLGTAKVQPKYRGGNSPGDTEHQEQPVSSTPVEGKPTNIKPRELRLIDAFSEPQMPPCAK